MTSCPGSRGVVRVLDWFELPDGSALATERPQRCQDLWYSLAERGFLTEPVARGCSARSSTLGALECTSGIHGYAPRGWNSSSQPGKEVPVLEGKALMEEPKAKWSKILQ
ncbi:Serine/threonine-protein kinase pim-3 [Lonchura striata]|uniref:Serine/threonine-protein kinase pim-3 n=1 Tax=Lonchura striata TaxID=40157 RepID=A0A218U7V9_9PASE|nr:Serine/threonine-protein kinase pim-3 [Lonchura striata domestica]